MLKIKRIYEPYDKSDGFRILVDRLWARGLTKQKAKVDLWLKEIAPSDTLRKWFVHDPSKWPEFQRLYSQELKTKRDLIQVIKNKVKKEPVTLLYAAKDKHNNAVALKKYLNL